MLGWILMPGRLAVRALDDIHDLAQSARSIPHVHDEIARLRIELQDLPEHVDGLRDAFEGSNRELDQVNDQLSDMRQVVEPLEPAAERIGKLAERLPGRTRPGHQRG
jgi:septal ring factor EnvC (AmiA/AmiB activator)